MCGVLGIYSKTVVPQDAFENALGLLHHRGPDFHGMYEHAFNDGFLRLGHTRLSILDPSPMANQPMKILESVLCFNGEIYNHQKLQKNLNHNFKTTSDTETLLVGMRQSGIDFLSSCSGMFAGAYYEETDKHNQLMIFRDTLGIKNLYYYSDDKQLIFSSEIKAIAQLLFGTSLKFDMAVVEEYLAFENYIQGKTIFKGIHHLLPGQIITISNNFTVSSVIIKPTIKIKNNPQAIEDSVARHLLSDFPLGVYLSGGIDSSLVASLAAQKNANLIGFTGFFKTESGYYDERLYARLVAKKLEIPLEEIEITPAHFIDLFDKMIYHLEGPKMGMGAFSQFVVAKEAAQKRRVILAGHGGDELFAGYPMFKAFWINENIYKIFSIKWREFPWVLFFFMNKIFSKIIIFAPIIFNKYVKRTSSGIFFDKAAQGSLERLFEYYRQVYIPGLLEVEDKISMAHSLETRVPLWDLEVIEFSAKISIEEKLKGGVLKAYLKEKARPYLPPELLTAPKRGFPTPLRLWFKKELSDFVSSRLLNDSPILDRVMSKFSRKLLCFFHKNIPLPFALDEIRAHKIWML